MKRRLHVLGVGVTILALMSSATGVAASEAYKVRKGDTLWGIAKRFGVSVDEIKRANGLSANKPLQIGQKLSIATKEEPQKDQADTERKAALDMKAIIRFGPRLARQLKKQAEAAQANGQKDPGVVRTALAYRGTRYVRGGTGARGFDCSGFTRHVYAKHGVKLPHSSSVQASCGKPVSRSELQPGDLVFFQTRRRGISHVGLYVGGDKFIHASTPRNGVLVSSLNQRYYASRYRGARRVTPKG